MKKNDIVYTKEEERNGWILYGRIWRTLPDGRHVVVCGGSYVRVFSEDELIHTDYKGKTFQDGKYKRMTSLRQLKKWAAKYNAHFGDYWNAWGRRWTKQETKDAIRNLGKPVEEELT